MPLRQATTGVRGASPSTGPSSRPFSRIDKLILGEILQDAENASPSASLYGASLLDVLRSYDTVLLRHGIAAADDTLYYRTLLKLSMNTAEPDWWVRLDTEIKRNAERFGGEAPRPASTASPATPGLGPRASPHQHPPSAAQRLAMTPAATAGDAALQAHHRRVAELAGAHGTHVQGGPSPGAYADASSPLTVGQLQSAGSGAQYALGSGAGSAAVSDARHHGGSTSALRVGGASASVHARTSALSATATATSASARRVRLRVDGDAGGDVLATPGFSGGSSLQPRGALFGTTHTSHEVTAQDKGEQAHGSGGGDVDHGRQRAHRHRHVHGHTHGHSNSNSHNHGSPGGASTGAATARSYHDFKRQAKAFRAWVAGVKAQQQVEAEERLQRRRLAIADNFHKQQLLSAAFLQWHSRVLERHARVGDMAHVHRLRFMRIHLYQLRDAARALKWEREHTFLAVQHWGAVTQRSHFDAWRRHVVDSRPLPVTDAHAVRATFKWICLTLPSCLKPMRSLASPDAPASLARLRARGLRMHVLARLVVRPRKLPLLQHANAVLDVAVTERVFQTWRQQTMAVRQLRAAAMATRLRWCCAVWHERAAESARKRTTVQVWRHTREQRALASMLQWWHTWTREQAQRAYVESEISLRVERRLVARTWRLWRVRYSDRVRDLHNTTAAVLVYRRILQRRCLLSWRGEAHRSVVARRHAALLMGRHTRQRFDRWLAYVDRRKLHRRRNEQASRHLRQRVLQRTLNTWVWAADAYHRAKALHRAHVSRRWFTVWRVVASKHKGVRLVVRELLSLYDSGVLANALRQWRHGVRESVKGRALNQRAVRHWHRRASRWAFTVWHGRWLRTRELREVSLACAQRLRHMRLTRSIALWRGWVADQRLSQARDTLGRRMCLRRYWKWWRRAVHGERVRMRAARHLASLVGASHLWSAFHTWLRMVRRLASLEVAATSTIQDLRCRAALRGWHHVASTEVRVRRHRGKVEGQRRRRMVRHVLSTWQEYTLLQMRLRRRFVSYIGRQAYHDVHKVAAAWKTELLDDRTQDACMAAAHAFHTLWKCRRAVRWWRKWLAAEKVGHVVAERCNRRLVGRVIDAWEVALDTRRTHGDQVDRLVTRITKRRLRRAVRGWAAWSQRRVSVRDMHDAVVASVQRRVAGRVWRTWHRLSVRSRTVHMLVAQFRGTKQQRLVRRCWRTWKRQWRRTVELRELLTPVLVRREAQLLRRTFAGWSYRSAEHRRLAELEAAAVAWWRTRQLHRGVRRWRQRVQSWTIGGRLQREAVWRWQNYLYRKCFNQLRRNRVDCKRAYHKAMDMRAVYDRRLLVSHWDAWHALRAKFAKYRARRAGLDALTERRRLRKLGACMDMLREHVRDARKARRIFQLLRLRTDLDKKTQVVEQLRAYARHRKERRAAVQLGAWHWTRRRMLLATSGWRRWAQSRQHNRALMRRTMAHLRNARMVRCWHRWCDHVAEAAAVRAQVEEGAAWWRARQLRSALAWWHTDAAGSAALKWAAGVHDSTLVRRMYGRWTAYHWHRVDHKDALAAAHTHWYTRRQRHALRHMHSVAAALVRRRRLAQRAGAAFQHGLLRRTFTTWELNAEFSRAVQAMNTRGRQRRLADALDWWQAFLAQRQRATAATQMAKRHLATRTFVAWREQAAMCQALHGAVGRMMAKVGVWCTHNWVRACFWTWAWHTDLQRRVRDGAQLLRWSAARRSLHRWRHFLHTRKNLRRAAAILNARTDRGSIANGWRAWVSLVQQRKQHRAMLTAVQSAADRYCMRCWFDVWHGVVARERVVKGSVWFMWRRLVLQHHAVAETGEQLQAVVRARRLRTLLGQWRAMTSLMQRATAFTLARERRQQARVLASLRRAVALRMGQDQAVVAIARSAGANPPLDVASRLRRRSTLGFRPAEGATSHMGSDSDSSDVEERGEGAASDDWGDTAPPYGTYGAYGSSMEVVGGGDVARVNGGMLGGGDATTGGAGAGARRGSMYQPVGEAVTSAGVQRGTGGGAGGGAGGGGDDRRESRKGLGLGDNADGGDSYYAVLQDLAPRTGAGAAAGGGAGNAAAARRQSIAAATARRRRSAVGGGAGDGASVADGGSSVGGYGSFGDISTLDGRSVASRGGASASVAALLRRRMGRQLHTQACLHNWMLFPAAKAFRRWAQVAREGRAERQANLLAWAHFGRTVMVRCWRHWRGVLAYTRACAMADAYRTVKVKRNVLAALQLHTWMVLNRRALLETAAKHHLTQRLSFAVNIWRRWAAGNLWLKERERVGFRRHCLRVLAVHWQAWCLVVADKRAKRLKIMRAYAHAARTLQRKVLRRWAGWTGFRRELKLRVLALRKMHAHRRLSASFFLWHLVAKRRAALRAGVVLLRGRAAAALASRVLDAWHAVAARQAWARRVSATFRREALLSRHLAAWCRFAYEQQREARLARRADRHWEGAVLRLLGRRLRWWSRWSSQHAEWRDTVLAFRMQHAGARCFDAWLAFTRSRRARRDQLSAVERCVHLQLQRMALTRWWHRVAMERASEAAVRVAAVYHRRRCLKRGVAWWVSWAFGRVRGRLAVATMRARRRRRVLSTVLIVWRRDTQQAAAVRSFSRRVFAKFAVVSRQRAFDALVQYVQWRRRHAAALDAADAHWRRRGLKRAVGVWCATVFDRVVARGNKQAAVAHRTSRVNEWVFSAWRARSRAWRELRLHRELADRHYVRRTSLELLRWWAVWAVTQARHNRAIAIVTEARVQRVLRASWKAWAVTYVTQRRQHRATMVMVEEWRLRSNVVRCIRRWHKHAAAQAVSRQQRTHAIAMWRSGLLGRVWNAWKAHAGARARVRRSVHTLEYWVWRSRFRVAWRVWRDGVALFNFDRDAARRTRVWRMRRTLRLWNRRAKVQALAARVTTRRQGVALCEALWTWRRFLCGQRVQRRRAQREAAALSSAVAVWRAKVAWILHERRMIPRAERLWRRNQQRWAFRRFHKLVQLHRAVHFMQARSHRGLLRRYFGNWNTWTLTALERRRTGAVLEMMVNMRRAREAWRSWRLLWVARQHDRRRLLSRAFRDMDDHAVRCRLDRKRVEYARTYIRRGIAGRALKAWRDLATAAKGYRAMLARRNDFRVRMGAKQRRRRRAMLATCFGSWSLWTKKRRATHAMVRSFRRNVLCRRYFDVWEGVAASARCIRLFTAKCRRERKSERLEWAFHRLNDAVRESRLMRFNLSVARVRVRRAKLARLFGGWALHTRRMAQARAMYARVVTRVARRVLRQWRAQARLDRIERAIHEAHTRRVLAACVAEWQAHTNAVRAEALADELANSFMRHFTVRSTLRAWRDAARRHKAARQRLGAAMSTLSRALQRNYFRTWADVTYEEAQVEVAAEHYARRGCSLAIRKLRRAGIMARARKADARRIRARARAGLAVWRVWSREARDLREGEAELVARLAVVRAKQGIARWRRWTASRMQSSVATQIAAMHWQQSRMRWGLRRLHTATRAAALERQMAARTAKAAHKTLVLRRCLRAWRKHTALQSKLHAFVDDSVARFIAAREARLQGRVMQAWADVARRRAGIRAMMARAPMRRVARCLVWWRSVAHQSAVRRFQASQAIELHEQRLVMKVFTAWRGQSYGTVVQSAARRRWEERGRAVAMRGGGGAGLEHLAFASGAGADSRASYDSHSVGSVSAGRRSGLDVDQSPSKLSLRPFVDMMR